MGQIEVRRAEGAGRSRTSAWHDFPDLTLVQPVRGRLAANGLTPLFNSNRNPAYCDAGSGSGPQHHKQSSKHYVLTPRFPRPPRRKPRVGNAVDSSLQRTYQPEFRQQMVELVRAGLETSRAGLHRPAPRVALWQARCREATPSPLTSPAPAGLFLDGSARAAREFRCAI